jgi:uncharacterized protein (TIGR02118 family)
MRYQITARYGCAMTVKLVVLYTQPDDPDAFDKHYLEVHMPLADALPGLERSETSRFMSAIDRGEKTYFRMTELYFADEAAMQAAFGTDEGKATAADYGQIAPTGSRMFAFVVD